jgi:uncharacterized membrane protein
MEAHTFVLQAPLPRGDGKVRLVTGWRRARLYNVPNRHALSQSACAFASVMSQSHSALLSEGFVDAFDCKGGGSYM